MCVVLEGFYLWNVCIKNNKISKTNIVKKLNTQE
jgi:hypothetical protein